MAFDCRCHIMAAYKVASKMGSYPSTMGVMMWQLTGWSARWAAIPPPSASRVAAHRVTSKKGGYLPCGCHGVAASEMAGWLNPAGIIVWRLTKQSLRWEPRYQWRPSRAWWLSGPPGRWTDGSHLLPLQGTVHRTVNKGGWPAVRHGYHKMHYTGQSGQLAQACREIWWLGR